MYKHSNNHECWHARRALLDTSIVGTTGVACRMACEQQRLTTACYTFTRPRTIATLHLIFMHCSNFHKCGREQDDAAHTHTSPCQYMARLSRCRSHARQSATYLIA
jgi:hypothetical protein